MPALEAKPAKVKKEDSESGEYKSVLEKPSQQKTVTEEVVKEATTENIEEEFLLDEDVDEEEFKVKVEKIKDKDTLINMINDVVDLHIENDENPAIDYKFGILIEHFKELFGIEECDKCFKDTIEKIREYNELKDINRDNVSAKPKKLSRFKNWRNKRKLKKQNKDFEIDDQDLILYQGQEEKLNKTKKAQAKGKGNWRKVLKYGGSVLLSIGVAVLCAAPLVLTGLFPVAGLVGSGVVATGVVLTYRDAKKKSKYRKQISNKIGGAIDKAEEAHDKSNMKKMEDALSKIKKEDSQSKPSSDNSKKNEKDESKNNELQNQQNQIINQNQQNQMMQNQMSGQMGQNPMMQNQAMGQVNNQYNPWNPYNPYQQNYPVDPYTQQYMQMMQQYMQNPMMQQMMNQFPQFQQFGTQGQQTAQAQPANQQNTTQPQTTQTYQQKIQQQATNAQQNSGLTV